MSRRLTSDEMQDRITDGYYEDDPRDEWPGWYVRGRNSLLRRAKERSLNARWSALLKQGKVRWMPGMRILDAGVVVAVDVDGRPYRLGLMVGTGKKPLAAVVNDDLTIQGNDALPDLTDPATLGCLLALVREAWSSPHFALSWYDEGPGSSYWPGEWNNSGVEGGNNIRGPSCIGDTEAEALIAALEKS